MKNSFALTFIPIVGQSVSQSCAEVGDFSSSAQAVKRLVEWPPSRRRLGWGKKYGDLHDKDQPVVLGGSSHLVNGLSRVNPLITGVITHLPSGMSHQVWLLFDRPVLSLDMTYPLVN